MILVVLDTNVLASAVVGLPREASVPAEVLRRWHDGHFRLTVSSPILAELERTLGRPYFRHRLSPAQVHRLIELLRSAATNTVLTTSVIGMATHPEDDAVLSTMLSARADVLVTGDRRLRERATAAGMLALTPREFLDHLDRLAT